MSSLASHCTVYSGTYLAMQSTQLGIQLQVTAQTTVNLY